MEKEFIPYEQALALKELGFDEPCFGFWNYNDSKMYYWNDEEIQNERTNTWFLDTEKKFPKISKNGCTTPTYSQAFRWFREKYGLVIQYIPFELDNEEGQSILHHKHKISEYDSWRGGRRNTIETELCDGYEEAELACLKKLIEIVKDGK